MFRPFACLVSVTIGATLFGCAATRAPSAPPASEKRRKDPPRLAAARSVELTEIRGQRVRRTNDGSRYLVTTRAKLAAFDLGGVLLGEWPIVRGGRADRGVMVDGHSWLYPLGESRPAPGGSGDFVIQKLAPGSAPVRMVDATLWFSDDQIDVLAIVGPRGKSLLMLNGTRSYPSQGVLKEVPSIAWAPGRRAVAALVNQAGRTSLMVVPDAREPGLALTWPLPAALTPPGLQVFWSSRQRVVVGPTVLAPVFGVDVAEEAARVSRLDRRAIF